ncbi:metallophosphoesterase family protein [Paenibacillus arenilitoris]|uniref:Metallophosphoesterase n=1 Tax=Paenibacillus arenilitoris TaxID=2772299 RepID=A0A927H5E2_9BACL|nr:metallophosphoesterase [Paenibacillus arenilitoris]MBD2869386.1 metallophosphoesterase [Paenibacillus arenilitoris]
MRLILMGDLHYHDIDETIEGLREARAAFYETYLGCFLEMDADYHISLGDLTNFGTSSELQEVYAILGRKERSFIHVLGNHDLYGQTKKEVLALTGQKDYHAIDNGEAILVFLNTAKEMDFEDWGGWIDGEQLRWFEETVQASGSKPMLVFAHHPVFETTARSEKDKGSIHRDIDMWSILGQKQGQGLFFNGHTHVDSIVRQHNWTFVQLSAGLDQHGFRIVDIAGDEIRIAARDVTEAAVKDHAQVLHRYMKHFRHNPDARGVDEDRETIVSLLTTVQGG